MKAKYFLSGLFMQSDLVLLINVIVPLQGVAQSQMAFSLPPLKVVPVIELKGNPYERGFQHGTELKKEIAEVFAKWKTNIRVDVKGDPDSVIAAFLKATNFEPI